MSEALEGALAGDLEEALIGVYERDREMFDADALAAIDVLLALWQPDREARDPEELSYWAYAAYEALRAICESYAGRDIPFDVDNVALFRSGHEDATPKEILDGEQIADVLQQLRRSIGYWQERGGFRGFYESIRD